jgi:hypothetical protein
VEDAAPGSSMVEAEVAERIEDPFGYTVAAHKLGEQFGIRVTIHVFLKGGSPVQDHHKLAGWLEKHISPLEHEVEVVSPEMFLAGAKAFLGAAGISDVLMVSLNGTTVTRTDDKAAPVRDDLESAVSIGLSKLQNLKAKVNSVVLEAFGTNDDFEVQMQLRFSMVHPKKAPGVIVYLWALPHELMERKDESEFFYEDRVNEVLQDKAQVKQLEDGSRTRMEKLVSVYEGLLAQQFPTARTSHDIDIDLTDITV